MRRWEGNQIFRQSMIMNEKECIVTGEGYRDKDFEGSGWKYIPKLQDAIDYAFRKHGENATVNISPYGGRFTYITEDDTNGNMCDDVMGGFLY